MLALDAQEVSWYWCMFEFECVIPWYYRMHYDTITIARKLACYSTAMAMAHGSALTLIEYME